MTVSEIRISISKCCLTKKDKTRDAWPPSLPDFIANGKEQIDYDAAYYRCLNKSPSGRLETWVYEKAYFNIKSSSDESARKQHKRFMDEAENLESMGRLVLNEEELLALPVNSVKNMNDLKREEFDASGVKHRFADRINALRKKDSK